MIRPKRWCPECKKMRRPEDHTCRQADVAPDRWVCQAVEKTADVDLGRLAAIQLGHIKHDVDWFLMLLTGTFEMPRGLSVQSLKTILNSRYGKLGSHSTAKVQLSLPYGKFGSP